MDNDERKDGSTASPSETDSEMMSSTYDETSSSSSFEDSVSSGSSPPTSPRRPAPPAVARVPALRFQMPGLGAKDTSASLATGRDLPAAEPRSSRTTTLGIELISSAFILNSSEPDILEKQCAQNLAVTTDRLRYFALVEIPNLQHVPPNCSRVALEVAGSSMLIESIVVLVIM